ncbi:MAG: DUF2330 domain-containing protein, partial [Myxococcales bacterium]|nr:DUF2330 domain-containing protein [Myxococcales bacterium]
ALKLLPGAASNDVVPLHLTFTSDSPAIPLRPTAVAAEPDMGIIVHLLGEHRAVPTNFLHVHINEAAIDWPGGGQNYADVVAAAADEAEGHAFATDYAGEAMDPGLAPVDAAILTTVAEIGTLTELGRAMNLFGLDADLQRVVRSAIVAPEGVTADDVLACPDCFDPEFGYDGPAIAVDGAALAQRLTTEINAPRELLAGLFERNRYLTRLFTRMSAAEMDRDPIFAFNPDLAEVPQTRDATRHIACDDSGFPDFDNAVIELADGQRVALEGGQMPGAIMRQAGETVRGAETQAAALIEQQFAAGQPDEQSGMDNPRQDPLPGGGGGGDGCSCDVGRGAPAPLTLLGLLGLVALRRRRRGEG